MLLLFATFTAVLLAVVDHRTGRMPNVITLSSLGLALLLQGCLYGGQGMITGLAGLVLVSLVPAGLFFTTGGRAIGGGDVKALAALGVWLGPENGLQAEFLSFSLLAVFSLVQEAREGRLAALLARSFALVLPQALCDYGNTKSGRFTSRGAMRETTEKLEMRFGPFLGVGTGAVCLIAALPSWVLGL